MSVKITADVVMISDDHSIILREHRVNWRGDEHLNATWSRATRSSGKNTNISNTKIHTKNNIIKYK